MPKAIKVKQIIENFFVYLMILIGLVFCVFPIYYTITTGLKSSSDTYAFPPKWIPFVDFMPMPVGWDNSIFGGSFYHLVVGVPLATEVLRTSINTFIVAICSSFVAMTLGCLAAYSLTRFRFQKISNDSISFYVLSQWFLPAAAAIIPYYLIMRTLGLLDTILGLVIVHSVGNTPFVIWLMKEYFAEMPVEVEESALVDGCSYLDAFIRIVLPLCAPGLAVVFLFCFVLSWNEFLYALILGYTNVRTMSVFLSGVVGRTGTFWYEMCALATISMIPPMITGFLIQKWIVRGLTFGAVKG